VNTQLDTSSQTAQPGTFTAGNRRTIGAVVATIGAASLAVAYIGYYLSLAAIRLRYPFELEWMEGGSVEHVGRLLAGQQLYQAPSLEFTPFIYAPFYYYVAAAFSSVMGLSFFSLRLVSVLASMGLFALVFLLVRRETSRPIAGLLAAGLAAAAFPVGGGWYDLARVDSLFLLLLVTAVYTARFGSGTTGPLLSAGALALAYLTKQSALGVAAAILVHYLLTDRRRAGAFFLVLAGMVAISTLVLSTTSDGWFDYYIFELPGEHHLRSYMALPFFTRDLALLTTAGLFGLFYLTAPGSGRRLLEGPVPFYFLVCGALFGIAFLSRLSTGGSLNVILPACVALAILLGLGYHAALTAIESRPAGTHAGATVFVHVAVVIQFLLLFTWPSAHLPSAEDRAAGERLIRTIASVEGEVLVLGSPHYPRMAGKDVTTTTAQAMAIVDIYKGDDEALQEALTNDITRALAEQRFAAIVVESHRRFDGLPDDVLDTYYDPVGPIFDDRDVFRPKTGLRSRPDVLYRPRDAPADR
jgi:hypothetical protein